MKINEDKVISYILLILSIVGFILVFLKSISFYWYIPFIIGLILSIYDLRYLKQQKDEEDDD